MNAIVSTEIETYAEAHSMAESATCRALREETCRCMEAPQMMVGPLEGAFLKLMTQTVQAKRILEIGMFTGYSALCFAEALSDDGSLTGRGHPWIRGLVSGAMTTAGGIGHTLPFLVADFKVAMIIAVVVVLIELGVITWVRHRYMETPTLSAAFQVVLGGALVFATGILIGSS